MALKSWGANTRGVLGTGSTSPSFSSTPVDMAAGVPDFVEIVASSTPTGLGRTSDGHIYTWGSNQNGELGQGTTDTSGHPTPAIISGITDVVQVAAGVFDLWALRSNGDLYGWGLNSFGQLGVSGAKHVPTLTATSVAFIASSVSHACLIKTSGAVQTVGDNTKGILGDGTTTARSAWTTVTPAGSAAIKAYTGSGSGGGGGSNTYLLRADGSILGVGDAQKGQLGITKDLLAHSSWVTILASGATMASARDQVLYYVLGAGTSWAIGSNAAGRLGANLSPGTTPDTTTAQQQTFPTGVTPTQFLLGASGPTGATVADDHLIYAWGDGTVGQMGDGTTTAANQSPVLNPNVPYATWIGGSSATLFADVFPGPPATGRRRWATVVG